jgi:hypothetical protein
MLNIIDLTFEFEYGQVSDRFMQVEIISGDQSVLANLSNKVTVKDILIPNQIKLKFSGKTPGRDTVVDSAGNIVQDMYVKLLGLTIDNLKVPKWVLEKKTSYVTDCGQLLTTSYIGFNGVMTIDIPESTVFSFYRRLTRDI